MSGSRDKPDYAILRARRFPRAAGWCPPDYLLAYGCLELGMQDAYCRLRQQCKSPICISNDTARHVINYFSFSSSGFPNFCLLFDDRVVSPNQRTLILRTGVENGGEAEWNYAFEQYKSTGDTTYLVAMTCTRQSNLIYQYVTQLLCNNLWSIQN